MSINENSAQEIQKRFNKRVSADPYLKKLMERVENGSATFADVDTYACQVAECYNTAIHEVLGDVGIEEYRQAVQTTIPKGFHALYDRASDYTEQFINAQLQDAGIGMKAVRAEYDAEKERDVTGKILERAQAAEEVSQVEGFSNLQVESFAQKAATNTLQKNAEVQNRAGLEVTVTRIYDGVGLHDGKDECKWCLERCGENMPYSEAYAKGAFSRHPGCHCEILYKTAKGIQRQTDWTHNQWEDVADEQALKIRRRFAEEDSSISAKERISKIPQIKNVTAEYLKDATPGIGKIIQEPGYTSKGHEEEKLFAHWLKNALGGDILQNKDSQTEGLHYADYTWRKRLWELKTVSSSKYNTFDQHVRKAEKQISTNRGGYLFDITEGTLSIDDAMALIGRSMKARKIQQTDVLIRKGDDFKILRIG